VRFILFCEIGYNFHCKANLNISLVSKPC